MSTIYSYRTFLVLLTAVVIQAPGYSAAQSRVSQVITGKVQWSGEMVLDGIIIVKKGSVLTVSPGTVVRFNRKDWDDDGIGDAELRVEGTIRILGSEKEPVLFTSAMKTPSPADWKFLMINHADGALVQNAIFEYAFSGIQVHHTRGTFSRIVSRYNVDGFRFSTAPVLLEKSLLVCNNYGLRFEERGAGAIIRDNVISGNRVGVFAVVKSRGLTIFTGNNIEQNSSYNFKLGEGQSDDVPVQGNWWGTADPDDIRETFFDSRMEPAMGSVIFEPSLPERSLGAGLRSDEYGRWQCP